MAKKKEQYKVAVVGAGSWGITLGNLLYENGNDVTLWEFRPQAAERLRRERTFVSLKGYRIPDDIKITDSLNEAVEDADLLVVSVPSSTISDVAEKLKSAGVRKKTAVVSTVKGFERKTLKRPSDVLSRNLKKNDIVVLSGPSHAEEVVNHVPTAVVVASGRKKAAIFVQEIFSSIYFRVYTSSDMKGVELGGALKNIIAIASGISSGLGMGDNTKAALITRALAEIVRLGTRMGAKERTFSGLSGIGDLIVTCFSEHSRNFRFGKLVGQGYQVEEALRQMKTTVEGVNTTLSSRKLAEKYKIQMPVCNKMYEVLFEGKPVELAWKELMKRPLKSEIVFGGG